MHSTRKIGVLALVAALMVVLGALRPAAETPKAEASLAFPGGIGALPSAAPAVPALTNQSIPAIIGTGQPGIVVVFCNYFRIPAFPPPGEPCPSTDEGRAGIITFEMTKLYPPDGSAPGLTFDANGGNSLAVSDNSGADMDLATNVVTVRVNAAAATQGGTQGVNEIVLITATDEAGERRSVQMIVVDTILAFGPTGPLSTASQEQPMFVSYHCDVTGRSPLVEGTLPWAIDPDGDASQGLDDMYDAYYATGIYDFTGPGLGYGSNTNGPLNPDTGQHDQDLPDVWCGGNTPALFDDFVDFQTDLGVLSNAPIATSLRSGSQLLAALLGQFYPPIVNTGCESGKSVNVADVDALSAWAAWLTGGFPNPDVGGGAFEGGCDINGWRDGVVTMGLLGNGEEGRATITAQQGGGVSPPRTIGVTFVGEARISLFLEAPATMGVEGGDFEVVVVDDKFRPVGGETVSCMLDPPGSGLIIFPQTGTTGVVTGDVPGSVVMHVIPTGAAVVAGEPLVLTCRVDRTPNVVAVSVVPLVTTESESVDLVAACNPLASTWADGTPIETVAGAVAPPEALDAVWAFDPESGVWQGYSPAAPEASDLASVGELDAIFVCMNASATISRPVIAEPEATATPTATPTAEE